MMKIHRIESKIQTKKKRTAGYARVSTMQENQEASFESQMTYFTARIQNDANMELIEIYWDHGISGVSAEKRPGFMRMIKDAEQGKFDLILVKSISRFARNSREAQQYIHLLKAKGVEVRFEREGISTFDPEAEMIFNFLAVMAQEESKSVSQNVRWTYEKLASQGIRHLGNNRVLGYDEVKGKLTPNRDAQIVKDIFEAFDAGMNFSQISELLFEKGIRTLRGKERFSGGTIRGILKNEIYKGDRLLQKQPPKNYMTHRPDPDLPYISRYLEGNHEAVVSPTLWNRVNEKLNDRQVLFDRGIRINGRSHFLSGRIYCGQCGCPMRIKYLTVKGQYRKLWKCEDRIKGKKGNGCKNDFISDSELLERLTEHLQISGKAETSPADFERVARVDVFPGKELKIELKDEDPEKTIR